MSQEMKCILKGVALALIISMALSNAIAEVCLSDYFSCYAELENAYGAYTSDWPTEAKVQLAQLMLDEGLQLTDGEKTKARLQSTSNAAEQNILASNLIESYYQDALAMDTYNIMLTELGKPQAWSYESKALYSSLLVQYGKQEADWDLFTLPMEEDIPFETAKDIAICILNQKFAISKDTLKQSNVSAGFFYKGGKTLSRDPVWLVEFENDQQYVGIYSVEISRQGEVLIYKAPNAGSYSEEENILSEAAFAVPSTHDAIVAEVIQRVRKDVGELGNYTEADVENMKMETHFIYHERFSYGWEPVWLVYIYQETLPIFKALYAYDGTFIDLVTTDMEFAHTVRNGYFTAGQGQDFIELGFWSMSQEERAQFSQKWIPLVDAYLAQNPYAPYPDDLFYEATRCVYGLPSENDITQENAILVSKQATIALGANVDTLDQRSAECLFDITDPQQPLWKIVVGSADVSKAEYVTDQNWMRYRVVINARTGDVVEAWEILPQMEISKWRF
ncbi:MAG: hypothetical protein RSI32_03070 [Clostridia bacterium]